MGGIDNVNKPLESCGSSHVKQYKEDHVLLDHCNWPLFCHGHY